MAAVIGTAVAGAVASGVVNKVLAPKQGSSAMTQESSALNQEQAKLSREQGDMWRTNYKPVEQALTDSALVAGSPEEQEAAANRFASDASSSFNQSRQALELGLSRRGINTASPAYVQAMAGIQRQEAATKAGGMNNARRVERDTGFQKRSNVASLGRNLASNEINGIGAAAGRQGSLSTTDFYQREFAADQARQGLAPVSGAIGEWAGKAAGSWIRNRSKTPATPKQGPTTGYGWQIPS